MRRAPLKCSAAVRQSRHWEAEQGRLARRLRRLRQRATLWAWAEVLLDGSSVAGAGEKRFARAAARIAHLRHASTRAHTRTRARAQTHTYTG